MASHSEQVAEQVAEQQPAGQRLRPHGLAVGLQLPVQAQSPRFAQSWESAAGPAELLAVAQAADRAGLDYVGVCDHVAIPRAAAEEMGTVWFDTVATLGWLAAQTSRVRLLSHVYVPAYRHPLVVAKSFATLDVLSGGRMLLGVGAGHVAEEMAALGLEAAGRGAVLDEAIDAIRAAFSQQYASHDGARWQFDDLAVAPRPVQPGGPPIWVGGSSPAALRRAALRGDGWLPQGRPAQGMRSAIGWLREERARVHGEASHLDVGAHSRFLYVGDSPNDLGAAECTGSPEQIAEELARFVELDVNHVQISVRSSGAQELCEQIERIGADVLPLLEGR